MNVVHGLDDAGGITDQKILAIDSPPPPSYSSLSQGRGATHLRFLQHSKYRGLELLCTRIIPHDRPIGYRKSGNH